MPGTMDSGKPTSWINAIGTLIAREPAEYDLVADRVATGPTAQAFGDFTEDDRGPSALDIPAIQPALALTPGAPSTNAFPVHHRPHVAHDVFEFAEVDGLSSAAAAGQINPPTVFHRGAHT